jgi:hypothetical protein
MKQTRIKLIGCALTALAVSGPAVYAKCAGAYNEGYARIQRCTNANTCPSANRPRLEVAESCPVWCCPGSNVVVYSSDCTFTGATDVIGQPLCCADTNSNGKAWAFSYSCAAD